MSDNLSSENLQVRFDPHSLGVAAATRLYQEDPALFFSEELKIQTRAMGLQSFALNPVQLPIQSSVNRQLQETGRIRQIIFKCRQPGISTWVSGVLFHKTALFPNVYSFVIAQDKTTVAHIFDMHDTFYAYMSPDVRPMRQYFQKGTEIVFGNPNKYLRDKDPGLMSKILVGEAKNINVGTGQTIHCLHMSEICRFPYVDPIKESLIPALSDAPGTIRIIESTAHFAPGAAWFRDQCERAVAGSSDYQYHFVEWWRLPEYSIPLRKGERLKLDAEERYLVKKYGLTSGNIKWRRMRLEELQGDLDSFKLSYPMTYQEAWITKETSTFPRDRLMELGAMLRPPKRICSITPQGRIVDDHEGQLRLWFEPEKGKRYDIGADIGSGDRSSDNRQGDPSVAEVIERHTNRQVAEWHGYVLPRPFADVLAALGRYYNDAQVAPEINDWGHSTLDRLRDIYTNIYIWRKRDTQVPKFTSYLGWKTQHDSKNIIVNLARQRLHNREVEIFGRELWEELLNFTRSYTDTGLLTYAAAPGYFDDRVMAWLIALQTSADEDFGAYELQNKPKEESRTKGLDPAYYDHEGLQPVSKGGWQEETVPWK